MLPFQRYRDPLPLTDEFSPELRQGVMVFAQEHTSEDHYDNNPRIARISAEAFRILMGECAKLPNCTSIAGNYYQTFFREADTYLFASYIEVLFLCESFRYTNSSIESINRLFRNQGCTWRVEPPEHDRYGQMTRRPLMQKYTDNSIIEAVIEPTLRILSAPAWKGVDDDIRKAFDDYKIGNYANSIGTARKALEGTLNVIIEKSGFEHSGNRTLQPLLETVCKNGLLPLPRTAKKDVYIKAIHNSTGGIANEMGSHSFPVDFQIQEAQALHLLLVTLCNIQLLASMAQS